MEKRLKSKFLQALLEKQDEVHDTIWDIVG